MDRTSEVFSAMQTGKPFKSYIKTILGKVCVTVWNTFKEEPENIILEGDPKKTESGTSVDVWSDKEDLFFRNMNRNHFQTGTIIEFTHLTEPAAPRIEDATDEELKVILNKKFLGLQADLNKIESIPVMYRLLNLARDLDKSEKITKVLEGRLSELQIQEFEGVTPSAEEEG